MRRRERDQTNARSSWRTGLAAALDWIVQRLRGAPPAPTQQPDPRQEALAGLAGSLPLRVIMTDRDMKVLAASKSSVAGMGGDLADHVGRSIYDIDPEYFRPFRPVIERCLAGETICAPRVRAREEGGGDIWLRTEISPWRDVEGEIGGLISVSVEITDVVEALEASERSEQRLQMAVSIADVHVWELDYATGVMTAAGAPETFFDGSLDPAEVARDTSLTIHPEDRERVAAEWAASQTSDISFRPEYRINRQDGVEVWASGTAKLVRDENGRPTGVIGAMQNITEQKKTEAALVLARDEAEAANHAKSAFLAAMSHEIRTPLNGVLGMAQAMAAEALDPVQRQRLDTIRQSGEVLLTVLNAVLDLSKIEAGKLELEEMPFDVSHLVTTTREAFTGVAAGKGLTLAFEIDDDARGQYRGDGGRLRQILYNLMSNALKFTETGEVRLHAGKRGENLVFTVSDTGIGIAPDRLPQLFQKFEQADTSTTRRFGGTGLGLAISRELASLMGCEIHADSQEGVGSQFQLIAPLPRIGDEGAVDEAATVPHAVIGAGGGLRVLAAEDNSVNQLVLRTLLQQAGVDPHIVSNGAEAVAAWRELAWDVILMDVQMPVMDGVAATRAIRDGETASGRARTPILALTANTMSHQVADYVAAGMDGVIAKPIRVAELFAAIQAIVDNEASILDARVASAAQGPVSIGLT